MTWQECRPIWPGRSADSLPTGLASAICRPWRAAIPHQPPEAGRSPAGRPALPPSRHGWPARLGSPPLDRQPQARTPQLPNTEGNRRPARNRPPRTRVSWTGRVPARRGPGNPSAGLVAWDPVPGPRAGPVRSVLLSLHPPELRSFSAPQMGRGRSRGRRRDAAVRSAGLAQSGGHPRLQASVFSITDRSRGGPASPAHDLGVSGPQAIACPRSRPRTAPPSSRDGHAARIPPTGRWMESLLPAAFWARPRGLSRALSELGWRLPRVETTTGPRGE